MDLIKSVSRRSRISDTLYTVLNISFALVLWVTITVFNQPYLAFGLVLLSKWRIFAVRPRFWFANLQTNIVDVLVGLSYATFVWLSIGGDQASTTVVSGQPNPWIIQAILTLLYIAWLLVIKPRSSRRFVLLQAGISQFVALTAFFSVAYNFDVVWTVAVGWLIGYACARHVLDDAHETETTLLSLVWGVFVAELSWLAYHWTIGYGLSARLMLAQISIIVAIISFLAMQMYTANSQNAMERGASIKGSLIFTIIVIGMLLSQILLGILQR